MPTGYTARVKDGTVTEFKDFAMGCARAMGACISMREAAHDAEIPEQFEPSPYHTEQLAKAKADLAAFEAMTEAEKQAARKRRQPRSVSYDCHTDTTNTSAYPLW